MKRHGSLQTSRERNVCNFDNFMVCAWFQFGFGSAVALYITCNYVSEFARNVFSLPLVKSGSIFRDAELVSLGGWLSKRMYKRSKIMVKSISILIWSYLTPSYLLSVCRLRMHSDLNWTKFLGHRSSQICVQHPCPDYMCIFFSIWSSLIRLDQGRCAQWP